MTTPRQNADPAVRYFMDNTTTCWARNNGSNSVVWTLMLNPTFNSPDLEYYVGHEPPPPIKRTINLPAATIELRHDEQYAGLVLKDDGTPLHHLVRMAEQTTNPLSWQDAKAWASKAGGELPTQREMSLIYAHCRAHVKHEWCWSGEVFEADTSLAWSCHFVDGTQSTHLKSYENDAIAVRRIPIEGEL